MLASDSDFRLYDSNALDLLAQLLAAELARPAAGQSPLEPELILIPQVAMRRWLQATLAEQYGIAANLEFLTPGEFVARALKANVPGEKDDLDAASLQWQLHAALGDAALMAQPPMQALAAYLGDGDALKRWSLAGELGSVFEKYQAWRRDLLLHWEQGGDGADAQAVLWRQIAAGRNHRARRIQAYLDGFEGDGQPLPQGLPVRLFAFAILGISPDVLRVLATQARVGTLHFYLPTPTRGYWGDLQSVRARLRQGDIDPLMGLEGESPLLASWGAAGRDFMALLGNYEVVHPSLEIDAYADPLESGKPPLAGGGLGDTLLRRLQGDLFHRRPPPREPQERLPALRLDDPSLQLHACHTRLRELQVLHDQLRGLLEDPRFDPPLQPREIAVLSPDIDPYVPYLEAVFGGRGSQAGGLPWALADTSPLAGEPLAEVFLRLLALPVSRFGLGEVLDLLASAPLAEVSGLDAADLERVRGWLDEAGARWGLDAGHRVCHQAPADAAYTWQFALDRLLLGHAIGEDADVAGVASLPLLEGSALDVLDAVLRLLTVLAHYQQALDQQLTPAQWSDRLLALLAAVLPSTPAAPAGQRALDRLRKLIGQFREQAHKAGYADTLPAAVVRAHFSNQLSQADTRAPLLTGGISFGRMVPLRLLPFRVICVLGLNDGDFPRRDPAAGLSKLVADLHNGQRRYGDRSVREDDRFLFLQLLASAQEVFYLSWIGSDARDGSVREPSVLVDELLEAAAAWHADPEQAGNGLVVHHTLQPFAADAFGQAGEPRRFSFRQQWHAAAAQLGQPRKRLPSWVDAPLQAVQKPEAISLPELRRFFTQPAQSFLAQRLGIRLPEPAQAMEDIEPLDLAGPGLERHQLQQLLLQAALDDDSEQLYERLLARGKVPSGAFGRAQLQAQVRDVLPYAQLWRNGVDEGLLETVECQVQIDGISVHGRVADVLPDRLPRLRIGKLNAGTVVRNGLDWLLLCAAGQPRQLWQLYLDDEGDLGPHLRPALGQQQARQALARLVDFYLAGMQQPLAYAPRTALAIFQAEEEKRAEKAWQSWNGSDYSYAEAGEDSHQLVYRGRDPLADGQRWKAFEHTALSVMSLLTLGDVPSREDEENA